MKRNQLALLFLVILFGLHLFFRSYEFEKRAQFTWDQVDNAWNAKNIIVNHQYPLVGMPAKQDSGVSIGPFYYYYVTGFYYLTDLDPIASPIIALVTSIFSFSVLFYVLYKIFNKWVALIGIFIHTFSFYMIQMDRIQWPVNFIAPVSFLVLLCLYNISKGKYKWVLLLSFLLGFGLHIHFTLVFLFGVVVLSLPLLPRNRKMLLYALYSLPLFLVWLIPFFLVKHGSMNLFDFFKANLLGFHLRHFIQIADTAFLESQLILGFKTWFFVKYLLVIVSMVLVYLGTKSLKNVYLLSSFILVPWIALTLFKGDITPYYFALNRFIYISMFSYSVYFLLKLNLKVSILPILIVAMLFVRQNLIDFSSFKIEGLAAYKEETYKKFKASAGSEFIYGAPQSYLYYFYERKYYGKK